MDCIFVELLNIAIIVYMRVLVHSCAEEVLDYFIEKKIVSSHRLLMLSNSLIISECSLCVFFSFLIMSGKSPMVNSPVTFFFDIAGFLSPTVESKTA